MVRALEPVAEALSPARTVPTSPLARGFAANTPSPLRGALVAPENFPAHSPLPTSGQGPAVGAASFVPERISCFVLSDNTHLLNQVRPCRPFALSGSAVGNPSCPPQVALLMKKHPDRASVAAMVEAKV